MKRRAGVWKGVSGRWWVDVLRAEDWNPKRGIGGQDGPLLNPEDRGHLTHREALDAALVAVGLAKPAEHREAP